MKLMRRVVSIMATPVALVSPSANSLVLRIFGKTAKNVDFCDQVLVLFLPSNIFNPNFYSVFRTDNQLCIQLTGVSIVSLLSISIQL